MVAWDRREIISAALLKQQKNDKRLKRHEIAQCDTQMDSIHITLTNTISYKTAS